MRIDSVTAGRVNAVLQPQGQKVEAQGANSFGDTLQAAIGQVNQMQSEADHFASRVATGDLAATQQAVLTMEKASLALDLTVQVRNKALEAYQELMRTQV
jgi:flagellar hook-basal body complex protein FliE